MTTSLHETLRVLLEHRSLTADETREAFTFMMSGRAGDAEMGALLALLSVRVPTSEELLGAARVMRENVSKVESAVPADELVDTCGTGGAPKTFNVSTTAAVVAAAAGAKVAKHGNRSRSGRGSAEVLSALGVNIDAEPKVQARCLEQAGLCFCFAIHHHPATKNVMPVRKALGVPTIFNFLGPLTNPAGARRQVLGVYDARFLKPMAGALRALGAKRAIVLHADDGLDEISISAPTQLLHVTVQGVTMERIAPEDVGLSRAPREAVLARDLEHATALARSVLSGQERGPVRDMTLLNAAAALLVAERAASLREGVALAAAAIDDGRAAETLAALVDCSNH